MSLWNLLWLSDDEDCDIVGLDYAEELDCALSRAQRIDAWKPFLCKCGERCRSSVLSRPSLSYDRPGGVWTRRRPNRLPFISRVTLYRLQVFNASNQTSSENSLALLDRMPNLRVVRWVFEEPSESFLPICNHPVHRQLTHLSIHLEGENFRQITSPIHFSSLEVLVLSIRGIFTQTDVGWENWALFPKLRRLSLKMTGISNDAGIVPFLVSVGLGLSSLMVDVDMKGSRRFSWFKPDTWYQLPSLVEFGPGIAAFTSVILPPPKDMKPLTIMVEGTQNFFGDNTLIRPLPLEEFLAGCRSWRTERITMMDSWERMERKVKGMPFPPRRSGFFASLIKLGVKVSDKEDSIITDPEGVRFLKVLEEAEVRTTNASDPIYISSDSSCSDSE